MNALFAIDIDRTICHGFKPYLHYHNHDLGLGLSSELLEALLDYQSFLHLPEVKAYRQAHEAEFQASRVRCQTTPDVVLALDAIPGAVAGTSFLAERGILRYYTIRAKEIREATKQWLALHRFPHPDNDGAL